MNARGQNGRFAKGNAGGPGRPRRTVEDEYLAAITDVVSLDDWQAIVARAAAEAKQGDARARDWLSRYLVGERSAVDLIHRSLGQVVLYVPDNGRRLPSATEGNG